MKDCFIVLSMMKKIFTFYKSLLFIRVDIYVINSYIMLLASAT